MDSSSSSSSAATTNHDDARATTTAPRPSSTSSSVPASPPSKPRANLALCRTDGTGPIGCLGGVDTHASQPFRDVLQPLPLVEPRGRLDGSTSDEQPQHPVHALNWRYEDGLLRAVDDHGYATNKCLGPFGDAVSLKGYSVRGKSCTPYELVLRDCPATDQTETFDYNASNERPASAAAVESGEAAAPTSSFRSVGESARVSGTAAATARSSTIEREPEAAPEASRASEERDPPGNAGAGSRHLRFLLTEDGRVQSLAPVIDLANGNRDISASKPFCLTVMKWREDTHTKAYLTPCHEDNVFNVVDKESGHLADHTRGQQQQFDIADGSSFDPFLVAWQSEASNDSDGAIHLAYQTGREASAAAQPATNSSNNSDNNYGCFDTLMVRVMGDGYCSSLDCSFLFDIELGKKGSKSDGSTGSSTSGILSLSRAEFKDGGNTKAYLMGTTGDGSEVSNFASASFVVSKPREALSGRSGAIAEHGGGEGGYQGWFLGLFVFLGIMVLYALCVATKKAVYGANERRGSRPSLDSTGCAKADAARACNSMSVGNGSTEFDIAQVSDYTNNYTHYYRSNDDPPLETSSPASFSRHTTRRSSMPRTRNPECFYSEYYPDATKTANNTAAIEDEEKTVSAEVSSEFFKNTEPNNPGR